MSTISRVGTHQSQSFILDQINKATVGYVKTQEQITTGYKSQRYTGISDYAAMSVNLSNSKDNLQQYLDASSVTNSRISAMHTALSNILDIVSSMRAQLIQGMTADQADDAQLQSVASEYLSQVESALNTDLGGVYLFGGTKNTAPPVDLSDPINNASGDFYSGAGQLMQARIDENTVFQYGDTANRQGFKDLVASLQRVISASGDLSQLETALDEMNSSLSDLTNLEAVMGYQMKVVEQSQTRNDAVKSTVVNQLSSIQDVDVSAAMVDLTQRETILQASYQVIARGSQLSLTNYL